MKTLKALYDLNHAPVTFDFAAFVVAAECYRQLEGYDDIDLTILSAGFRQKTKRDTVTSEEEKRWRIDGILMQCCTLFPTVTTVTKTDIPSDTVYDFPPRGPEATPYMLFQANNLYKCGANPKGCVKAPAFANELVPQADITLTIRSSRHFPERNVVMDDWLNFHDYINYHTSYSVIVVPDQEDPGMLRDWHGDVYLPAAYDLRLRYALYEQAKMNVVSANGPTSLLYFTDAPFIQFDALRGGTIPAELYHRMFGFESGHQPPWLNKNQCLAWEDSTLESLKRRFGEIMALKKAA
jgi:hypothetical protein